MQPRAQALHLLPDRFVAPSPRTDHHEVRPVPHEHPRVEKRVEVLARLDGADKEDESLRQLEAGAGLRSLLCAHGMELRGNAVRHDLDAAAIDAKVLDEIACGAFRDGYQDV